MVVYQALYGDGQYWVRPERMFFETVERDGHRFARFSEIDKESLMDLQSSMDCKEVLC